MNHRKELEKRKDTRGNLETRERRDRKLIKEQNTGRIWRRTKRHEYRIIGERI